MQGIINILKPCGLTSSDVVVKIRGILKKQLGENIKCGHMGTLDPGAAGVLPIAVGKATRLFDLLLRGNKLYRAAITFGKSTDTLDSYGIITNTSNFIPDMEELSNVINEFIGKISQYPPMYSSISIGGRRAYELAREGIEINLKPREIQINSINIVNKVNENTYIIDIDCQGGTYIRSLIRDIARKLNTEAYMSYLIRLKSDNLEILDSVTIKEFEQETRILSVEDYLKDYSRYYVEERHNKSVINGVKLALNDLPDDKFLVYLNNSLFGIGHNDNNILKVDIRL